MVDNQYTSANKDRERSLKIKSIFDLDISTTLSSTATSSSKYNNKIYFDISNIEEKRNEIAKSISSAFSSTKSGSSVSQKTSNISKNCSRVQNLKHEVKKSLPLFLTQNKEFQQKKDLDKNSKNNVMNSLSNSVKKPICKKQSLGTMQHSYLYVSCINCHSMIHIELIDKHSNSCNKVKQEVFKAENYEFCYKSVEYKLNKLLENLQKIKQSEKTNKSEMTKDLPYLASLETYIVTSLELSLINNQTLGQLKKLITNLDALNFNFKGTNLAYILMERGKVLLADKIKILKEDLKKALDSKKLNGRVSGTLNGENYKELEKQIEQKIKEKDQLEQQTILWRNSATSLKKFSIPKKNIPGKHLTLDYVSSVDESMNEEEANTKIMDNNIVIARDCFIDVIESDIDLNSEKSNDISDCTSMTSGASLHSFINERNLEENACEVKQDVVKPNSVSQQVLNPKKQYRDFAKVMLKVKFELLSKCHRGQEIKEKFIWKEVLKKGIPQTDWRDFVYEELQNWQKYILGTSKKAKSKFNTPMDPIEEEF